MAKNQTLIDGLLIVDKPTGLTSHDVVGKCRRFVGQKRIGHAGTLDPGATGVLLVALGRATRLMRYVSELPKYYVGEVVLGTTTNTLDDEGNVTGTWDMSDVQLADVQAVATKFTGPILQVPPMVSAIKIGGKRLHQLAREGLEVKRPARPVTIHALEVSATEEVGVFRIEVQCSSGTYIRSLAADIGAALGGGAHLRRLRRTAIGPFTEADAVSLDVLEGEWRDVLHPPSAMVAHLHPVAVSPEIAAGICHGRRFARSAADFTGDGPWAVYDESHAFLAVYEIADGHFSAGVVLGAQ